MNLDPFLERAKVQKVLFVEDELFTRKALFYVLENIFKEAQCACDGIEAIEILEEKGYNYFDIVITDLSMPRLGGLELIRNIKVFNPLQTTLIISASEDTGDFLQTIDTGVDAYLLKPIDSKSFISALDNISQKAILKYQESLPHSLIETRDALTHLAPLTSLLQNLSQAKEAIALFIIHIDSLSLFKDHIGTEYANAYLADFTHLLRTILLKFTSNIDAIYRIDYDEIAVTAKLLPEKCHSLAKDILAISQYHIVKHKGINLQSQSTIGIYYGDTDIYEKAINVLAKALDTSVGSYEFSSFHLTETFKQQDNIYWLKTLWEGIEQDNLHPFYQPIFNISTQQIEKYECLARLKHSGQIVTPQYFFYLASKVGHIGYITKSILRQAYLFFQDKPYDFTINLTVYDLKDTNFFSFLDYWQRKTLINPERVTFEFLETESFFSLPNLSAIVNEFRSRGYKIALDDFGTGYSNFASLLALEFDIIKIDGLFIKNLSYDNPVSIEMVKNIHSLIHLCKAKSVAEYVHNKEVFDIVCELGIDYAQGYYIGEPVNSLGDFL